MVQVFHQINQLHTQLVQLKWLLQVTRARLTSIQGKGIATDGSIIFRCGGATGTIIATFLFGEEGLDMYLPGNGILFLDGIHATIANTARCNNNIYLKWI